MLDVAATRAGRPPRLSPLFAACLEWTACLPSADGERGVSYRCVQVRPPVSNLSLLLRPEQSCTQHWEELAARQNHPLSVTDDRILQGDQVVAVPSLQYCQCLSANQNVRWPFIQVGRLVKAASCKRPASVAPVATNATSAALTGLALAAVRGIYLLSCLHVLPWQARASSARQR